MMEEGGMKTCSVCGKLHVVTWPHLFPYRRGEKFYCSYDCMAIDETKDMNLIHQVRRERRMRKLARMKKDGTPAKRPGPKPKTAARPDVPVPKDGGDWEKIPRPAAELKLDGAVRIETPEAKNVQVVETPEKGTLADAMLGMKAAADNFFGQFCPEEKKEEQPEPERPAPFKYRVTGIQTEVGEFWVVREGKIKWVPGRLAKEDPVMQVMWPEAEPALVPEMWRRFAEIILDVLDLLEVES